MTKHIHLRPRQIFGRKSYKERGVWCHGRREPPPWLSQLGQFWLCFMAN